MDLKILQYNVHKSKKVLEPLLASNYAVDVDILAVQEPWHSTSSNDSCCPRSCPFYLIYLDSSSRVAFYINKKFSTDSWTFKFHSKDLVVLELFSPLSNSSVKVVNCYSEPPSSFNNIPRNSPIPLLQDILSLPSTIPDIANTSTVLLGDFNIHHPLWCSVRNPSAHALSNTLISTISSLNYSLLTPNGLPTFTGGRGLSTIDLAFCSLLLLSLFTSCTIYKPLCFNSDHEPILLSFMLESAPLLKEIKRTRVGKKQDK